MSRARVTVRGKRFSPPVPRQHECPDARTDPGLPADYRGRPVGCELGQLFARARAEVTIRRRRRRRLLPDAEPEASEALTEYLRSECLTVRKGIGYRNIDSIPKGVKLTCETEAGETTIDAEQILAASGSRPNVKDLQAAFRRTTKYWGRDLAQIELPFFHTVQVLRGIGAGEGLEPSTR